MAYDNVMGVYLERLARNLHALARSCLSGNSDVWGTYDDRCLEHDVTRNVKHDDARTTLFASPTEGAGTVIIEVGNGKDFSATTAKCVHTAAFSTGERRYLGLFQVVGTRGPWHIGAPSHSLLFDDREGHCPCRV